MRTKTLLIAAATIAAGIASSMAQSTVYSVNLVGYINTPIVGASKYTLIANPFDNGAGNTLTSLVDSTGALPNKSQVLLWTGSGYSGYSKSGGTWSGNPAIPQSTGFFVKNGIATSPNLTNLFVGTCPSSNSVALPAGYTLSGGLIPFSGDLTTDTNINLGTTLPNKSQLLTWSTASQSFTGVSKSGGSWGGTLPVVAGQGFFINAKSATTWTQKVY
ncbi:MAG: hypothetical protein U1F98_10255 [Verrucomicrobiota bacterium]